MWVTGKNRCDGKATSQARMQTGPGAHQARLSMLAWAGAPASGPLTEWHLGSGSATEGTASEGRGRLVLVLVASYSCKWRCATPQYRADEFGARERDAASAGE